MGELRKITEMSRAAKKWIEAHPPAPQDLRPPLIGVNKDKGGSAVGVVGSTNAPNRCYDQGSTSGTPRRVSMSKEPRAHPDDYRRRPVIEYDVFKAKVPNFKYQEKVIYDEKGEVKSELGRGAPKYRYFMRRGL